MMLTIKNSLIKFLGLVVLGLTLNACGVMSDTGSSEFSTDESALYTDRPGEYRIGASDEISISVWDNEQLDRSLIVRPDGMITLPLAGEIYVIGMTPDELQTVVEDRLSAYVNNIENQVSVVVDAVNSYAISVLGNVREPGRIEFRSQPTVVDALAAAGGFTEFASRSNIQVIRNTPEGTSRVRFNYNRLLRSDDESNLVLMPGDVVLVP